MSDGSREVNQRN